ncbi:MAG: hypothetical protein AAF587_44480, partial [Bacteroidota bacterium]
MSAAKPHPVHCKKSYRRIISKALLAQEYILKTSLLHEVAQVNFLRSAFLRQVRPQAPLTYV